MFRYTYFHLPERLNLFILSTIIINAETPIMNNISDILNIYQIIMNIHFMVFHTISFQVIYYASIYSCTLHVG